VLNRKLLLPLLSLLVSLAVVSAACSSNDTTATSSTGATGAPSAGGVATTAPPKATGAITVSAASSLTDAFNKIGTNFKAANPGVTDVKFNFDSSGTLATQIQSGAPADSFASADTASMQKLTDANLILGTPQVFARNKLTIVVKKGNPKNVQTLADLAKLDTVSLCSTDAPCGKYADQILQMANVTIPTDKITRGQNVKATLTAVSTGDADAGIVYVTDANDQVDKVAIPDSANAIAVYPIGVVKASTNQSTAQAFEDYVLSPPAQMVLQQAGFLPPS
jgi:molybdate transport system substrate-binding protein